MYHKMGNQDLQYSVLMSVYANDNPEYLRAGIESMLAQTVPPEQFVLVIDGPVCQELQAVIDSYERRSGLFTVCRLSRNAGLGNALNEGLKLCRNELIARMDADDISLPYRCEKELQRFAEKDNLDICGCNIDEFFCTPDQIRTSRTVPAGYTEIVKFMRRRQAFNHPTVIYKKSKVLAAGGYQALKRKEDFDLFSRMLAMGCYAENVDESLYLYRANEDNYGRRKSWNNFASAVCVYWRHYKRKGCSLFDFMVICCAEAVFLLVPSAVMKWLSDHFLRSKPNIGKGEKYKA